MIRAAASGVVDFSQANAAGEEWWRRTNALLDDLARKEDEDLLSEAYKYHLALMSNSALTDDSFNRAKKIALDTFVEIFNLSHPWEATSTKKMRQEQILKLRDAYKRLFGGDPSDPEFKKRLEADVARDQAKRAAAVRESQPEEELRRRVIANARDRRKKRPGAR